jgi:carboxypeptidase C (cathepsin A)
MTAKGFALLGALVAVVGTVNAYPAEDLVKQLWQWDDISFGLYSGYVDIPNT